MKKEVNLWCKRVIYSSKSSSHMDLYIVLYVKSQCWQHFHMTFSDVTYHPVNYNLSPEGAFHKLSLTFGSRSPFSVTDKKYLRWRKRPSSYDCFHCSKAQYALWWEIVSIIAPKPKSYKCRFKRYILYIIYIYIIWMAMGNRQYRQNFNLFISRH